MSTKKFVCVAKCPELDIDYSRHCTRCSIDEDECDYCPAGNDPYWYSIELYNFLEEMYQECLAKAQDTPFERLYRFRPEMQEYLENDIAITIMNLG